MSIVQVELFLTVQLEKIHLSLEYSEFLFVFLQAVKIVCTRNS